jgi:hypothetical protein
MCGSDAGGERAADHPTNRIHDLLPLELARHGRQAAGRLISRDHPAALAGC